jgi:hypothetical protein
MTSAIRINHFDKEILISKSFEKAAHNPNSREYKELMEVMNTHPTYKLAQRAIKKNPQKQKYPNLTYEYMRDYIILTSTPEDELAAVAEFDDLILRSRCQSQSNRYPVIKRWFLNKYPEIKEFGMIALEDVA